MSNPFAGTMVCRSWLSATSTSFLRHSSLLTFFSKNPSTFLHQYTPHHPFHTFLLHRLSLRAKCKLPPVNKSTPLSSLSTTATASASTNEILPQTPQKNSSRSKKKEERQSPENVLRYNLDMCSKRGDLLEALRLYDDARQKGIQLSQHHYNVLLYLCSSPSAESNTNIVELGQERGFEIYHEMGASQIPPNEATFTSLARLAASLEDPEMAFDLIKKMLTFDIPPKLRSYGPALFGFCKKGKVEEAYEVDAHMANSGVLADEPELSALLKLSSDFGKGDKVYQLLHRLRTTMRRVSDSTAEIVEEWFRSDVAAEVGEENWNVGKVKEGVAKGGGGWHGQGWLGKGKWNVVRTKMDERGVCGWCGEKLVCIDIDPVETENFASSLSSLACRKEVRADFTRFQEWLARHGPFEAVIDGANVGIFNQQSFSFSQLNSVVQGIRKISPLRRLPLIILHNRRTKGGPADNSNNKKLLESWQRSGMLYATPAGSNDDWYWLYAAVSCRCLLVTNDEMRDHLFELLGNSFFPQWKEKHQVRLSFSRHGPAFAMPPPYSIVIQESEGGNWHIPTVMEGDIETAREWICATRTPSTLSKESYVHVEQTKGNPEASSTHSPLKLSTLF